MNLQPLKTYILADRLGAHELLIAVSNQNVEISIDGACWYDTVIFTFKNIPSERRIVKLLVDTHCRYSEDCLVRKMAGEEKLQSQLPHEFLLRVMMRYRHMCKDRDWEQELRACDYQEHSSEEERGKCWLKQEETYH
jgi:hypothetical protein